MGSMYHIAMLPWFAVGHMTPFLHLANKLAERGHKITFFLPTKAQYQLQHHNRHPELITFHPLSVPQVEGLPPGTETASDIPIYMTNLLAVAMDLTRDQVEVSLRASKPDFVFFDFAFWVAELSRQLGIKSVCYNVVSAASLAIALVPARNVPKDRAITEEELAVPPPGYPSSTILMKKHEARSLTFISQEFGEGVTFYERCVFGMKNCDAIAIRTCVEIEGQLCDYIGSQFEKKVLVSGPVLPDPSTAPLDEKWNQWLGGFQPGSVVFCAFGSQFILEKKQFQELVLGFELTGLPFFIAVKPPTGTETVEEALPEAFEERVRERGVVYGGWVQQLLMLNHSSVGCFVSHCGFGSMWESLMSDCQIVLIPQLGDQILNTRLMAQELKLAVEVDREDTGWFSKESVCKAIKSVMDKDSEMGSLVRKNHAKWKQALVSKGIMTEYINRFVQSLEQL
ncbi:UDP-glucuronosyl/UDP-glucosyltransferase [Dillenia turbinata]|uniref:Glycosyltransferase n=1 Tax=Dillenia turbinata TaxID=194707 RepID=A0AAN8ZH83_9MAGN